MNQKTRFGQVVIVGRANVGKSTLINALMGTRTSIVSHREQTTRCIVHGIETTQDAQMLYVDTPGLVSKCRNKLSRHMNASAHAAIQNAQVVLFVLDRQLWGREESILAKECAALDMPVIVLINKIDILGSHAALLNRMQALTQYQFEQVIPVSSRTGQNLEVVREQVRTYLPESPFGYASTQRTVCHHYFFIEEEIRAQVFLQCRSEVPYAVAVQVEQYEEVSEKLISIQAVIFVERFGQKKILIGSGGRTMKLIGSRARQLLEKRFKKQIMLKLWVSVREKWSKDDQILKSLGYLHQDIQSN